MKKNHLFIQLMTGHKINCLRVAADWWRSKGDLRVAKLLKDVGSKNKLPIKFYYMTCNEYADNLQFEAFYWEKELEDGII